MKSNREYLIENVRQLWWLAAIPVGMILLGLFVVRNSTISSLGFGILPIVVTMWVVIARSDRRFDERLEREKAERAPSEAAFRALSEADARRLLEELIAEGAVVAFPAQGPREGGVPAGLPRSVGEFYSAYERLETPDLVVTVGSEPIVEIEGQPGHFLVDQFGDFTAGARVGDPLIYHGAEFCPFDPDDSFPSMWNYALFALADTDQLIASGRIPAPIGKAPGSTSSNPTGRGE